LQRNAALSERVQHAAARKAQTDEQLMMRIGHELHDGPAQELSLALLRLEGLRDDLAARVEVAGEDNDFIVVQSALERSLREIRGIASGLRLPELDALTLKEVIDRAVDEHERRTSDVVDLTVADLPEGALAALKIAMYRIIKESLNNSHRHGGVTAARVSVSVDGEILVLEVSDAGSGFDPQSIDTRVSLGLRGMRERAELLGGSLAVVSQPGGGTAVTARLPLSDQGA
jgi:signal transduction histidine kinase